MSVCVCVSHSRRHTRTQCAVGEGIWKYGMEERGREGGRKRGSQQLTEETCNGDVMIKETMKREDVPCIITFSNCMQANTKIKNTATK